MYWDDIIEKVNNHVLPSGFQFQNKWINAGTAYRRLVEPLDIVDYYHLHKDHGIYLLNETRPNRHKVMGKYLNEMVGTIHTSLVSIKALFVWIHRKRGLEFASLEQRSFSYFNLEKVNLYFHLIVEVFFWASCIQVTEMGCNYPLYKNMLRHLTCKSPW